LSSGLKGRKIRNEVLRHLMPLLWNGLIDDAIEYLENLDHKLIKDQSNIIKLIEYLKRNYNYIPCYSVRKKLGLRNSSNVGEKMNDLIISERQKHNGMSWSKDGSICLAGLSALIKNNESERWFADEYLEFNLAA
jgi:RIO-like serine/threonine protein kinase